MRFQSLSHCSNAYANYRVWNLPQPRFERLLQNIPGCSSVEYQFSSLQVQSGDIYNYPDNQIHEHQVGLVIL